jgi:hypothetical protein
MDKINNIIQFNPPKIPEDSQEDQIREVVNYVIDNAPTEALIDFSKQFLTESFKNDPVTFKGHYKSYCEHMDNRKSDYGQLLKFTNNKGDGKCP